MKAHGNLNLLSLHSQASNAEGSFAAGGPPATDDVTTRTQNAVAWIIVVGLLAASIAAAWLLWAKANGAWPLSHKI